METTILEQLKNVEKIKSQGEKEKENFRLKATWNTLIKWNTGTSCWAAWKSFRSETTAQLRLDTGWRVGDIKNHR